jgi:predicted porin
MYSKKMTIAAVAIAAILPTSAMAQSSVQFYGKLYPEVTSYTIGGGTAVGTTVSTLVSPIKAKPVETNGTSMDSSNSYIGFRGSEDLGNGLKAIFQLEGAVGVDDGTLPKGVLFNRDTYVGLTGGFGTIKMGGRMDTVYKTLADRIGFFGASSGNSVSASNILAQGAFGSSNAERFHERPNNTVMYASPDMAGFQALVGYSLGEVAGNASSGNIFSSGIKYDKGRFYFAAAYEEHIGLFGGSSNAPAALSNVNTPGAKSNDRSLRLTAMVRLPTGTRLEVDGARTKLEETGGEKGHFANYVHNSFLLSADQVFGAWTLAAAYGRSQAGSCALVGGAACSTGGLEASMTNFGANYSLSKRTSVFALYSMVRNGYSGNLTNALTAPASVAGQSLRQVSTGLMLAF